MLLERFLEYVKIDTQSDEESNETPSTKKQFDILKLLKKQLDKLGVDNELTKEGRIYAYVPGNEQYDAIGLCAHVDTAPDFSGTDVDPQVIKYEGGDVKLGDSGRILSPTEYSKLNECVGKTLITTNGNTLLGADDKAGVAIIMEIIVKMLALDESTRRPMYVLFTPDEEVGRGAEVFDTEKFKAKFAYTFDGDDPRNVNIETFNAKSASVDIVGKSIHPGDAKGIMVNAGLVLNEFISMLPKKMIPSRTEGHQGFNHLCALEGSVSHASMHYILRNHDENKLFAQQTKFEKIANKLSKKYPSAQIKLEISDSYKNMLPVILKNPECKDHIEKVYKNLGILINYVPIRGGTDGATFSYKGCPTPNLGTGSYNHHGPYEFAVLEEMEQLVDIGVEIFKI